MGQLLPKLLLGLFPRLYERWRFRSVSSQRADAMRAAARYLAECVTCGEPHEMRKEPGTRLVTWSDPLDGHNYRRRADARSIQILLDHAEELEQRNALHAPAKPE